MSWVNLSSQLVTLLGTVTSLSEVAAYMKEGDVEYPIACISPSEFSQEYASSTQNTRDFAFTVFIRYGVHENQDNQSVVDGILRAAVDDVMNKVDAESKAGGGLLNNNCYDVKCDNYAWGYRDAAGGQTERVAPVRVLCRVLKDL